MNRVQGRTNGVAGPCAQLLAGFYCNALISNKVCA